MNYPTAKQIDFAKDIAAVLKIDINDNILSKTYEIQNFINQNKDRYFEAKNQIQKDYIIKNLSLPRLAELFGYEVDKKSTSKRNPTFKKGDDKIICSPKSKSDESGEAYDFFVFFTADNHYPHPIMLENLPQMDTQKKVNANGGDVILFAHSRMLSHSYKNVLDFLKEVIKDENKAKIKYGLNDIDKTNSYNIDGLKASEKQEFSTMRQQWQKIDTFIPSSNCKVRSLEVGKNKEIDLSESFKISIYYPYSNSKRKNLKYDDEGIYMLYIKLYDMESKEPVLNFSGYEKMPIIDVKKFSDTIISQLKKRNEFDCSIVSDENTIQKLKDFEKKYKFTFEDSLLRNNNFAQIATKKLESIPPKKMEKGSKKRLFIANKSAFAKEILITEAPIDAISALKMKKVSEDTVLLSTMGSIGDLVKPSMFNFIKNYIKYCPIKKLTIGTDNDKGGYSTYVKILKTSMDAINSIVEDELGVNLKNVINDDMNEVDLHSKFIKMQKWAIQKAKENPMISKICSLKIERILPKNAKDFNEELLRTTGQIREVEKNEYTQNNRQTIK